MPTVVNVQVLDATETIHTYVSRDVADEYYELPEPLVVAYEQAQAAYRAAQEAITGYIAERRLQPQCDW